MHSVYLLKFAQLSSNISSNVHHYSACMLGNELAEGFQRKFTAELCSAVVVIFLQMYAT